MDPRMKEERETIAEILALTKKRPYPTKETVQLARFVESCFYVIEDVKKKELKEKQEKEQKIQEQRKKEQELKNLKELAEIAPVPTESEELPPLLDIPLPTEELPPLLDIGEQTKKGPLAKREYVLQIYNNPIGILIEKEQDESYQYKVIEPYLEQELKEKAQQMYGKEFERDNTLFENNAFLKRVAEKVAKKTNSLYTDLLPQKIAYYLERDILGGNVFDPLLYDEKVKNIICNGPNRNIKVDYDDLGMMETNIQITKNETLNSFMKRLAKAAGKSLNEQNPIFESSFEGFKFEGTMGIGGANSKISIRRLTI